MIEESNIVTLYDEENNPIDYEHLDTFEVDSKVYIVLLEVLENGEENDEVCIFRLEEDENGEDLLSVIEDEAELMAAFEEFENRLEDIDE
ncbi:MAG: DUF1292 domain-containing protein [Ruminococcaceae bacterium]|nr:DUF1292 domain-containing protein [Oscillospiraceae bacterium]